MLITCHVLLCFYWLEESIVPNGKCLKLACSYGKWKEHAARATEFLEVLYLKSILKTLRVTSGLHCRGTLCRKMS